MPLSYTAAKHETATELEALARELPRGKRRKSLLRRAKALRLCGTNVALRRCGACSEDRAHSGRLIQGVNGGEPCGLRSCAFCARVASNERNETVLGILAGLDRNHPNRADYRLRLITITVRRDPFAEGPHTVEAMRATTRAFCDVISRAWRELLRRPGAGMLRSQEISGSGHIHVHMLYWGPYVNQLALARLIADAWAPHEESTQRIVTLKGVDVRDATGDHGSISREVVKYATKAPSPMSEGWLRGAKRDVLHPKLLARYELAVAGLALTQLYGAFRGARVEQPKVVPPRPDEDHDVGCPCCGVVGTWVTVVEPVQFACHRMHAKGRAVLQGSRWRPPEWREG